jgi:hypothetical protein
MDMRVSVAEGKYTFVFENNSRLVCLRYGEEWRDLVGDGAVLALVQELADAQEWISLHNEMVHDAIEEVMKSETSKIMEMATNAACNVFEPKMKALCEQLVTMTKLNKSLAEANSLLTTENSSLNYRINQTIR